MLEIAEIIKINQEPEKQKARGEGVPAPIRCRRSAGTRLAAIRLAVTNPLAASRVAAKRVRRNHHRVPFKHSCLSRHRLNKNQPVTLWTTNQDIYKYYFTWFE